MKIAVDLEGTLIAECGEFPCEYLSDLARCLLPAGIRVGARPLLQDLVRGGHQLTLYTSAGHHPLRLWLWCLLSGLPVRQIVTLKQCKKAVRGKSNILIWPPVTGQDLVLDDSPRHLESARNQGVPGLLVTNRTSNWTTHIRDVTLAEGKQSKISPMQVA